MMLSTFILVFTVSGFSLVTAVKDVLAGVSDSRCLKTNYKGKVTDLASSPNGVNLDNFEVAKFRYEFLQERLLKWVNQITFESSDNLGHFYVVFTKNSGSTVTTKAIHPNDQTFTFDSVDNVKRVEFNFVPIDYSRDIRINGVAFKSCPALDIGRLACNVLDSLKDIITIGSLGIIKPGGKTGTFSITVTSSLPYFDLDLSCIGAGPVFFSQLKFGLIRNVKKVLVNIWNGAEKVATDTFNPDVEIPFASRVIGDRIQVSFVPEAYPIHELFVATRSLISLSRVQILTS